MKWPGINISKRYRERRTRVRATERLVEGAYPEGVTPTKRRLLQVALNGLEASEWFFPSKEPHKIQPVEAETTLSHMEEELRRLGSHVVDLAFQAASLRQFRDEFPEAYASYPEELRQRVDAWSDLLIVDNDNLAYRKYLDYIERRNQSNHEE